MITSMIAVKDWRRKPVTLTVNLTEGVLGDVSQDNCTLKLRPSEHQSIIARKIILTSSLSNGPEQARNMCKQASFGSRLGNANIWSLAFILPSSHQHVL